MSAEKTIDFKNVRVFKGKTTLLQDLSLSIESHSLCYLVGRTGSGKSSFMRALYADLDCEGDQAMVCGEELPLSSGNAIARLRRKQGMIFQDFKLFEDWTVEENLDFVLKRTGWKNKSQRAARVIDVLNSVDLVNDRHRKVTTMSGGEQQRIAVARALLNSPQLILADEPTANLDPKTADEIMYLVKNIHQELGNVILIATHDYRIIDKFPGRVFECDQQTIQEIS